MIRLLRRIELELEPEKSPTKWSLSSPLKSSNFQFTTYMKENTPIILMYMFFMPISIIVLTNSKCRGFQSFGPITAGPKARGRCSLFLSLECPELSEKGIYKPHFSYIIGF